MSSETQTYLDSLPNDIIKIDLSNRNLAELPDLSRFINLQYLECADNHLIILPKLHETLMSREEVSRAKDLGEYFSIPPDLRDLNYGKFIDFGDRKITISGEYNSSNTSQLDIDDLMHLISTAKIL